MEHPGPPRVVAVGDEVELAPRDPDPDAAYAWAVVDAPEGSRATVGDAPVTTFVPDVPGRYRVRLDDPDAAHHLTVRAFPADYAPSDHDGLSATPRGTEVPDPQGGAPAPPYPDATPAGDGGRPRLRLDAEVGDDEVVVRAAPRPHPDDPRDPGALAVEFLPDDRDALSLADPGVTVDGHALRVDRDALAPGRQRVHAVAVAPGASGHGAFSVPDVVALDVGDEVAVSRPNDPPAWSLDATVYEVYVRSWADPDEGQSPLADVRARLDYLDDLGVDTLWLTPVVQHDGHPHGYNAVDFLAVASDLGTRAEYEALVEAAHDRGMRVLFDLVCNHTARDHPHFRDAYENPDSPYRDWYEWEASGEPATYFDWPYIANLDFTTLAVRRHLLDVVDQWAPLVDGFRVDMAWAVPTPFWREVRARVKAHDPAFVLVDETIPYIPEFAHLVFDVHFDSTLYFRLRQVGRGHEPATAVLDAVADRARSGFPDHAGFLAYAENHDETRYLAECGRPAARAAVAAAATLPGVPLVYGGQETAQLGRRDELVWDEDVVDHDLRAHVARLLAAHRRVDALHPSASLDSVDAAVVEGAAPDRVVAFGRGERVVVVLNFGETPATVSLDPPTDPVDLLTGDEVAVPEGVRVRDAVVLERR
jgi:glycosidase